jgi:hypothetical protein
MERKVSLLWHIRGLPAYRVARRHIPDESKVCCFPCPHFLRVGGNAVPCLTRPVAGLWLQSTGCRLWLGRVGFMVDKVALGQDLLPVFRCYLVRVIPPVFRTHIFFGHRHCTVLAIHSVVNPLSANISSSCCGHLLSPSLLRLAVRPLRLQTHGGADGPSFAASFQRSEKHRREQWT